MEISSNIVSYNSDHSYYSISNASRGYAASTSSNYATVNMTRGSGANTYIYWEFSLATIPANATINSITCNYRCGVSSTSTSYVASAAIQMCSGTTTKGNSKSIMTTSPSATTFTSSEIGTWTAAEINAGVKLKCTAKRGTTNTSSNYAIRFYGADITVTYTERTGNTVYIKSEGVWKEADDILVKSNGSWVSVGDVYKKVNGSWVKQGDTSDVFDSNALYVQGFIYATNNLVMNLDGITSYATRYTDTTAGYEGDTVYPNGISGNFMRVVDVSADGTSFIFNGSTSWMRPNASAAFDNFLYSSHTIEAYFELSSLPLNDGDDFLLFVGRNSKLTIALYAYYYNGVVTFIKSSSTSSKTLTVSSISANTKYYIAANADGWMFNGVYYPDSSSSEGTSSVATNDIVNVNGQYTCASIGMRFRDGRSPAAFHGKLYALRIHNAKLTEAQMRNNMNCDKSRFGE